MASAVNPWVFPTAWSRRRSSLWQRAGAPVVNETWAPTVVCCEMRTSSLTPVIEYARISTIEQGDSGLALAAQEAAIRAASWTRGL